MKLSPGSNLLFIIVMNVLLQPGFLVKADRLVDFHQFHTQIQNFLKHGVMDFVMRLFMQVRDELGRGWGFELIQVHQLVSYGAVFLSLDHALFTNMKKRKNGYANHLI